MSTTGLRKRQKEWTRRHIAAAAAGLFAERGYENVAVLDVARAAEVAEQTVYNYFPTKEHLVLDLEEPLRDRLVELIRARAAGVSPAAAIRPEAVAFVEAIRSMPGDQIRGGLGYLAAVSPTVRRLSLEMTDRTADAIAAAIAETPGRDLWSAKLDAVALACVYQTITDETGRRSRAGQSQDQIADELSPIVTAMIDHLDNPRST